MAKTSAWMIVLNLLRTLVRSDVPMKSKFLLLAGIVYLISPVDLLPDVIIGGGWIDDLIIVPFLGWLSYRSLPATVQEDVSPNDEAAESSQGRVVLYTVILLVVVAVVFLFGGNDADVPAGSSLPEQAPVLSQ